MTATQQSVSCLEPSVFECIMRLCYAVLEVGSMYRGGKLPVDIPPFDLHWRILYRVSNLLLYEQQQRGQYHPNITRTKNNLRDRENKHSPLFANLRLWERMLLLHQHDQQNNERKDDTNVLINNDKEEEELTSTVNEDTSDNDDYDSSATMLYEMVGNNVTAEDVSRFTTRISEDKGWFATE